MNSRNVLVVGGAGYIGSHTTLALMESGYNPVIYDNFSTGHREHAFGGSIVHGDIRDIPKLVSTIKQYNIDVVVHFAALIEAGASVLTPLKYYQNNVAASLNLFEAMSICNVRKIVFSSTAAVYGIQNIDIPLSEKLPTIPINPYGESKLMIEKVLNSMCVADKFQAIALRYFNACGADAEKRTGEKHDPETHLIPLVIEAARGIRPNISIFGTDYNTPDGTCLRDYVHVSDLASGHVAALNHLMVREQSFFKAYNLGTGEGLSVREIIDSVKKISKSEFEVKEMSRRHGDPDILIADSTAANDDLGWVASNSGIENIVKTAWEYSLEKL